MKKIILFVLVFSAGFSSFAQDQTTPNSQPAPKRLSKEDKKAEKRQKINALIKQEEEGNLAFRKQSVFGIQLRTNGYGVFYELGKRKSQRYTNLYTIELTEIKHRKEEKTEGAQFFSNSFVYGKENNFYQAKLGFGQQYILGQKGNKNGVAVTLNVSGGIDIGLLKPYYIDVQDQFNVDRTIRYKDDSTLFLNARNYYGATGFTKGWDELEIKPGIFLKSALRFDFGRYNESVQALEIGISAEGFSEKIPILAHNDPQQIFVQMHIAFVFGGRK